MDELNVMNAVAFVFGVAICCISSSKTPSFGWQLLVGVAVFAIGLFTAGAGDYGAATGCFFVGTVVGFVCRCLSNAKLDC